MTELELETQARRIAAALKSRRVYLKLTQEEVAHKTGVLSARTVQRAEAGQWLGTKQLVMLCYALEINFASLLESH